MVLTRFIKKVNFTSVILMSFRTKTDFFILLYYNQPLTNDKIRNDSLRNSITALYDFKLPRRGTLISWHERDYENEVNKLKSFLGPTKVIKHKNYYDYLSKFPDNLFFNQEFMDLIKDINVRST